MIMTLIEYAVKIALFSFCVWLGPIMKGKPFIAFWLWIKDKIAEDRKLFPGYGFYAYVGLGGSGKTLSMVEYLESVKRRYPKVKIYTNFDFDLADGKFDKWEQLIDLENFEFKQVSEERYNQLRDRHRAMYKGKFYEKINNGVIFGFDEIHMTLDSRKWKSAPEDLLYYISQQRKNHKMIICSAQVFTRMNVILREQTNYIVECKAWFSGRLIFNRYYHTETYIPPVERRGQKKKIRPAKKYSFIAWDKTRKLYDTEQVMVDLLNNNKTNDQQLLEQIRDWFSDLVK